MSENEINFEIEDYKITLFKLPTARYLVQVRVKHTDGQAPLQEDVDYFNNILPNLSKYQILITALKTVLIDLGIIQENEEIQNQAKKYSYRPAWIDQEDRLLHTNIQYETDSEIIASQITLSEVAELIRGLFKWEKIVATAKMLKALFE